MKLLTQNVLFFFIVKVVYKVSKMEHISLQSYYTGDLIIFMIQYSFYLSKIWQMLHINHFNFAFKLFVNQTSPNCVYPNIEMATKQLHICKASRIIENLSKPRRHWQRELGHQTEGMRILKMRTTAANFSYFYLNWTLALHI